MSARKPGVAGCGFVRVLFFSLFLFFFFSVVVCAADIVKLSEFNTRDFDVRRGDSGMRIGFTLENKYTTQESVRFEVQLVGADNVVADFFVSPDAVNASLGEPAEYELYYPLPDFLEGEYRVMLLGRNAKGLTVSMDNLGSVNLTKKGGFLEFDGRSCFLTVGSEEKKYSLTEGVSLKPDEELHLTCRVVNSVGGVVEANPVFDTRFRTVTGDAVSSRDGERLLFGVGFDSNVTFVVPVEQEPQAYSSIVYLVDSGTGKILSNRLHVHYVVSGLSATIQTFSVGKRVYGQGDSAGFSMVVSPSADNFDGSRVRTEEVADRIRVVMKSGSGEVCGSAEVALSPESKNVVSGSVAVERDCADPVFSTEISREDRVLDSSMAVVRAERRVPWIWVCAALLVLVLIFVVFGLRRKKGRGGGNEAA